MNEANNQPKLKDNFIKNIYIKALLPNIIAVLGGTINVFFDGILVGQRLGEPGLAAVSQCLPVYLVLCTVGSLYGSGASFISSIAMGEDDVKKGVRVFRATLITSALTGLAVCALGLLFIDPITHLLGAANNYDMVRDYLEITLYGGVFKVLLYVPFFYLRLEGKNNRSASAMLTMTILNIALDYYFLFINDTLFPSPIMGASFASAFATAVACVMSFTYLFTDHPTFTPGLAYYRKDDWMDVINYGSPMALNNIFSSLRILFVNLILKSMGVPALLAVFAVLNNTNEFSICIQNGVPQTASAMTGVFFGEKDSASVKKLLNMQFKTGAVLSVVFVAVLVGMHNYVGLWFGCTHDCSVALYCFGASLFLAVANNILTYYFNEVGRIELANIIIACRSFIMVVAFAFLFRMVNTTIWLFYPCAELATFLLVLWLGATITRKEKVTKFYLLDESFEKSGQCVTYTVSCDEQEICDVSKNIEGFCEENGFDSRKTMAISLAIEELLIIISQKNLNGEGEMGLRVLKSGERAIVRIRNMGSRYNPIEACTDNLDYMGVRMIMKMAQKCEYLSALGVNTLIIFL